MSLWKIATAALCLALAVFILGRGQDDPRAHFKSLRSERQVRGPYPSDWFMAQRVWPNQQLTPQDLLQAHAQAEQLVTSRALDDPMWTEAGPTNIGGRVADIVGHPTDEQVFYVAAASGGIFKTEDAGFSWIPVFDQSPSLSMGALAIDLSHPDTIYAGTGEACSAGYSYFGTGVYRTVNGGQSWTHLGLADSRYIARIVVDQTNPQSLWVAAMGELYTTSDSRGLYHSANGGESWQRVLFVNDTTGCSDVVIHPTNPQIVYAAMWQRIRGPENRYSGGRGSGIYRSQDGGVSWTRLTDGLPPVGDNVGRIGLAISESNPNILMAIYADHPGYFLGVFRTTDGGESWGQVNDGALMDLYSSFGWYFGNIRIRPDDPSRVYVLGVNLMRSTDSGNSWEYTDDNVHVDHHALWFHRAQPSQILLGNDGGVYRSGNAGNTWNFIDGLPINQFYAMAIDPQQPQILMGGTQDNGTLRTWMGGINDWDHIHGGDGFYCLVDPRDSDVMYAEYQWGYVERSDDGGWSWIELLNGLDWTERTNWSTPIAMSPQNPDVIYYGSQRLYRSNNRGDLWAPISPDLTDGGGGGNITFGTLTTISPSPLSSNLIWVGTDDANVWVTRNGGTNWSNVSAGLPDRWITRVTADPFRAGSAYVTLSGFRNAEGDAHLYRTTDYGASWQNITGDLPTGPLNDVIPDPQFEQRLYVASDFGVFVSPDWGGHWSVLGEALPSVPVIDIELHGETRALVAATYGRSMYRLDLSQLILDRPPHIDSSTPATLDTLIEGQTVQFSVEASDPDGDTLTYRWTRNGSLVGENATISQEFSTPDIRETIRVEVSDGELITAVDWSFFVARSGAVEPGAEIVPHDLTLAMYPNPFNAVAVIDYALPSTGEVEIAVFDLQGRRAAALISGRAAAGRYRLSWNAEGLPSGTYFVRLTTSGGMRIQKALLLR